MSDFSVYRFINNTNDIVYVGRTKNLVRRFLAPKYIDDNIKRIEYIECKTEADMIWKEIYYINLFFNEKSLNRSDVYKNGVVDMHFNDVWKVYCNNYEVYHINENLINERLTVLNCQDLIQKIHLLHVLNKEKLNDIGSSKYDLSKKWFYDHQNDEQLKKLSNNISNFFNNICYAKTAQCLWTTYTETKRLIKDRGFVRGFTEINDTSESDRINLAFLCNIFFQQVYKIVVSAKMIMHFQKCFNL